MECNSQTVVLTVEEPELLLMVPTISWSFSLNNDCSYRYTVADRQQGVGLVAARFSSTFLCPG